MSSVLETQQRKFGMIASVCCSDQGHDLPKTGDTLLIRHVRKGKSSKYAARNWGSDPCNCAQSDCCLSCSTEEGQHEEKLIYTANRRDLSRSNTAARPLSKKSIQRQEKAEPPIQSVARPIKSVPGWDVSDVNSLTQAVEVTAHTFRIKPPNYTEIQVSHSGPPQRSRLFL
jgi:hypothetical protein